MDYRNSNMTPPPYYGANNYGSGSLVTQTNAVMKRVYVRMFIGLLISAFCALGVASSPAAISFVIGSKIVFWGILIALVAMAWILPAKLNTMSTGTAIGLFCLYAALMGVYLAPIFVVYTSSSIAYTFFITSGTFGAMSVYGYFTKSDLSKLGTYLIMGVFGLFIAMIVNIFLKSSTMMWIISIIGVLLFTGLTAFDTQQVKRMAAANLEPSMQDKLATMGALNLYLDFINLFLFLLRIVGGSRN